jgi:hypothetical protein
MYGNGGKWNTTMARCWWRVGVTECVGFTEWRGRRKQARLGVTTACVCAGGTCPLPARLES